LGLIEVFTVRVKQGKVTTEFKRYALRILSTSGRPVAEVAADLGIGKSTLQRWKTEATETELLSGPHRDVEKELARLQHENKILRQERDLLKNAAVGSTGQRNGSIKGIIPTPLD
jgi:transposase